MCFAITLFSCTEHLQETLSKMSKGNIESADKIVSTPLSLFFANHNLNDPHGWKAIFGIDDTLKQCLSVTLSAGANFCSLNDVFIVDLSN